MLRCEHISRFGLSVGWHGFGQLELASAQDRHIEFWNHSRHVRIKGFYEEVVAWK